MGLSKQFRELERQLRQRVDAAELELKTLRAQYESVLRLAEEMERAESARSAVAAPMPSSVLPMSESVKRSISRTRRHHLAQEKFAEYHQTTTTIAKELNEPRSSVSAWLSEGKANRAIPMRHALYLRDRYGIPIEAWARVGE